MKFKETFNARGEKRPYFLGEDGREYFIYHDRTGYVIRDMCNDDIDAWLSAMRNNKGLSAIQVAVQKAAISQKLEKDLDSTDSLERIMVIFNPSGELIGSIDVTEKELSGSCRISLYLKNPGVIKMKGKRVLEIIERMNNEERLYDEIWIEDTTRNFMRIA